MKKYKIIKTYPGSDKLGTVITLDKNGECWSAPQLVVESDCKNNPEFFEEVVQKDYEILSVQNCLSDVILEFNKSGICIKRSDDCNLAATLNLENCLKSGCKIFSIRRLSDNEVFSINDKVTHPCGETYTIKSFKISNIDNNPDIVTEKGTYGLLGLCIRKAKPVLFVTEDGVEIFEGQYYCHTNPNFEILESKGDIISGNLIGKKGYYYFSLKEKAQEFIVLNKPVLSLKDVASVYPGINKEHNTPSHQAEQLKALVKSRL